MKNRFVSIAAMTALVVLIAMPAHAAGDAANGAKLYTTKCAVCHSSDMNKVGPKQAGVFGRKAGLADGYNYSPALKASGVTWDEATLDKWLTNPSALVAGTKMSFRVADAKERADIIAHLKTLTDKK